MLLSSNFRLAIDSVDQFNNQVIQFLFSFMEKSEPLDLQNNQKFIQTLTFNWLLKITAQFMLENVPSALFEVFYRSFWHPQYV
jgi:hypothetical protein